MGKNHVLFQLQLLDYSLRTGWCCLEIVSELCFDKCCLCDGFYLALARCCVSAKYMLPYKAASEFLLSSRVYMSIYTNTEAILFHLIPRSPYGDCTTTSAKLRHIKLWFRWSEIPSGVKQCGFKPARLYPTGRECYCCRHFSCSYFAKCGAFSSTRLFTSKYCYSNCPAFPDSNAANYINNSQRHCWWWVPSERRYNRIDLVLLIKPDYATSARSIPHLNVILLSHIHMLMQPKNVQIHASNVTCICSFIFCLTVGFPTAEVHYVEAPSEHALYPNGNT